MKPTKKDIRISILITGQELEALKELTWCMAEAYGLDKRIENYKGMKPIGLYRWDMDCLMNALEGAPKYMRPESWMHPVWAALLNRLQNIYSATWKP